MQNGALTGTMIDGRYRVGPVVGSGGFGVVYAATHLGLAGKVALKVPRVTGVAGPELAELIARFFEEGRLLKRLRHPGVVAALDVGLLPPDGEGRALPYLVLEWCEGIALREWLARLGKPLSQSQAWTLLRPVFEAIAHAHENDVAHRDLKPGNIILEEQRGALVPRVIDFGIAKLAPPPTSDSSGATVTTSESRAYTPRYAAPEQLVGLRSGPRSDVYSLALLLIEVMRGQPVFASDDAARRAVAEADLPTPRRLGLDLGAWNDVLGRALSLRPADRFADARAFLAALDAALPSSPREPLALEVQRSKAEILAAATKPAEKRARRADFATRTVPTGNHRTFAFALHQLEHRKVWLAIHTGQPPFPEEWNDWVKALETSAVATGWDSAQTPNLVITDGGAPNTAQRTAVNSLVAQAKTLPAVAVVTSSMIVRVMARGLSIFNPNLSVFAPAQLGQAIDHVGLRRGDIASVVAACLDLEAEVLGPGAVATLAAISRTRV